VERVPSGEIEDSLPSPKEIEDMLSPPGEIVDRAKGKGKLTYNLF
jgi:hypothetical protein